MESFSKIIESYATDFPEYQYYLMHVNTIRENEEDYPDVAIECCASLLQGLSKTVCYTLDPSVDKGAFEKSTIEHQVKEAFRLISDESDVLEIALPRACSTVARLAGEIRNKRGDISHGKAVPKGLESDASLARLALDMTEALARYLLCHLLRLNKIEVSYFDNKKFNSILDDEGDKIGKTPYSKLIFDHDPDAYISRLDEYTELNLEEMA